jgi:metal-dependent amidase/aminoacylase/carboxypeptidase family protein
VLVDIQGTGPINTNSTCKNSHFKLALRADMDALPIKEQSDLPYVSQTNAAHMCGHDGHMALLLGAIARI